MIPNELLPISTDRGAVWQLRDLRRLREPENVHFKAA
jgi:hypothetical protein